MLAQFDHAAVDPMGAQPTLSASVVAFLQNAILRGEFPPGSQLSEVPLARRLATSRTTIREAFRSLSEAGLVVLHPRRGAFVATLSPRTAREIYSMRALLEPFAVKLALTEGKIRSKEITGIETAFADLKSAFEKGEAFAMIEADMAFHWAVCSPCGHELVLESLRGLQARTRQFIFYTKFYESDAEGEAEAHMPILTALRATSPEPAEAALRHHITTSGERLLVRMLEAADTRGTGQKIKNP
jgi:DNA-binding GntR family transcriptional regulator